MLGAKHSSGPPLQSTAQKVETNNVGESASSATGSLIWAEVLTSNCMVVSETSPPTSSDSNLLASSAQELPGAENIPLGSQTCSGSKLGMLVPENSASLNRTSSPWNKVWLNRKLALMWLYVFEYAGLYVRDVAWRPHSATGYKFAYPPPPPPRAPHPPPPPTVRAPPRPPLVSDSSKRSTRTQRNHSRIIRLQVTPATARPADQHAGPRAPPVNTWSLRVHANDMGSAHRSLAGRLPAAAPNDTVSVG